MLFLQIIHNWTEWQGQFWRPKQNKWRVRLPICFQIPFQGNIKTYCLQTAFPIDSAAGVILWGSRHPLCTHCGSLYTSATKWQLRGWRQNFEGTKSCPADIPLTKNNETSWREGFFCVVYKEIWSCRIIHSNTNLSCLGEKYIPVLTSNTSNILPSLVIQLN